jgi:hypothetical protein
MDGVVLITSQRFPASFGRGLHAQQYRRGADGLSHQKQQFIPTPGAPGGAGCRSAAAPPTADRRQAQYFVRLLTIRLYRIDYRIDKCRRAITSSASAGDVENVVGFRVLLAIEQQERRTVEELITNLHTRFELPGSGPSPGRHSGAVP